ncbi:high-affinity nickel permease [Linnemannia elongata]|nr:high-affinity nickel permease [Linnemannia elongata]
MSDPMFSQPKFRRKCIITMGGLVLVNILVWILAGLAAKEYPSLLGAMVIAYTLGLRHAVDADHLAAIDNVTRKLIYQDSFKARAEGLDSWTPPVCVGLFFSLGHSTIVIVASVALALTATAIKGKLEAFGETGGIIGTSVSAAFLFLIGFINLFVLFQVVQELRALRRTSEYRYRDPLEEMIRDTPDTSSTKDSHNDSVVNETENKHADDTDKKHSDETVEPKPSRFQAGGLFARIFRPLFNLIDRSWKMYPLGVLFGLGFDTATEVGLLGIAATNAQAGFPTAVILIFPALFTAGMSLIDTLDGIIMVKAYGWAFVNPVKKLWYNFVVTLLGVIVAFAVGIAELLALLAEKLNLEGPFWDFFTMLSDNFGLIGYVVLATFILTWVFAVLFYKYGPMKDLERRVAESGAV